jgi:hypothetical protein
MIRKKLLWVLPALVTAFFLFTGFGGGDNTDYPSGSPGGYTGSPGDGQDCTTNCHSGTPQNVTGWITSNVPGSGYVPGTSYTITATATGSGNKGFEISPQSVSGTLLGTLSPGPGTKRVNSNKAVTHNNDVSTNPAVWTFTWTAPAAGTGAVTFYGAFAMGFSITRLTTMVVNEATSPLTATATASPLTICSGQTSQLDVTVSGTPPPYTFSWTSDPPGFTSGIQNPLVTPSVTTTYLVQVSDGTNNASSSVTVTVNPPPSAVAGIDSTVCVQAIQFPVSGTASNYSTVMWTTSGDGTFGSATLLNTEYIPGTGDHTNGSVDLTLTASPVSPCENASISVRHVVFDPCLGISGNPGGGNEVLLTPNPSTGLISIRMKVQEADIMVFNDHGKQVISQTFTGNGNSPLAIDLSTLPKGLYYLKVKSNEIVRVRKVILY